MKRTLSMVAVVAVMFAFTLSVRAEEPKEVTLKGSITCAKCDLKKETKCATVIKVTKDGKDTVYYFDPASDKKHHKAICTEAKDGVVKGTVEKKGDKLIIKVSDLKFD